MRFLEQNILYKVPVIWLKDYTQEVIFQRHLLFLLPFYIIKYEKSKERLSEDEMGGKVLELETDQATVRRIMKKLGQAQV